MWTLFAMYAVGVAMAFVVAGIAIVAMERTRSLWLCGVWSFLMFAVGVPLCIVVAYYAGVFVEGL